MAKTIPDLVPAATLDGTEMVEVSQAGKSRRTTTQTIANLGGGGGGGVASVVAGNGISVDDTDPENPVVSATSPGGGVALESYQNSAMSAAVMAYVFRDEDDNIFRVYEPIRNNDVSRSVFAYADSIDKFPFDSADCFNATLKDCKWVNVSNDVKVQGTTLETMIINATNKTGIQFINSKFKGNYGGDQPHAVELYLTGNNIIFNSFNCIVARYREFGWYIDTVGDNCQFLNSTLDAPRLVNMGSSGIIQSSIAQVGTQIKFNDKTGCQLNASFLGSESYLFYRQDSGVVNDLVMDTSGWCIVGDEVQYCTLGASAGLGSFDDKAYVSARNINVSSGGYIQPSADDTDTINGVDVLTGSGLETAGDKVGVNYIKIASTIYEIGESSGAATLTPV